VALALALLAPSAEALRPERPCFDLVVRGTLGDATNVVNLNDIMPRPDGELYLGFSADVQIRVTEAESRELEGETIWVRAFFTDMPLTGSRLRFLLRQREDGVTWYRGVYWDLDRSPTYDGSLPRCRPEFDVR